MFPTRVTLVEVEPRDGLQNEASRAGKALLSKCGVAVEVAPA